MPKSGEPARLEIEQVEPQCQPVMGSYLRIATALQPGPGMPTRVPEDGQTTGATGGWQSKAVGGLELTMYILKAKECFGDPRAGVRHETGGGGH